MSTITLNGVSSKTKAGLLIQSLPPIVKPEMRVNVETIDGRSGDIITPLGYAAYDKTVTIGLFGSYDIDAITAFFASSGTVIFSNEPDRVYNYTITQRIDYERLCSFRTAQVVFHCQPFKFSATEATLTKTSFPATVTNSGNIPAKPIMTVYGSGGIGISLNGNQIFAIALGTEGNITIDTEAMEAYKGTVLKNRLVTGDYDDFGLVVGSNTIAVSGTVTKIEFEKYSRWI